MIEAMTTIGAACVLTLAFAMLALTQDAHWELAAGDGPAMARPRPGRIRALASAGLAGALALCLGGHGAAFGSLLWALLCGASGVAVAFMLAWRPGVFARLARALGRSPSR